MALLAFIGTWWGYVIGVVCAIAGGALLGYELGVKVGYLRGRGLR